MTCDKCEERRKMIQKALARGWTAVLDMMPAPVIYGMPNKPENLDTTQDKEK